MAEQNGKTIIKDNAGTITINNSSDTKILERMIEVQQQHERQAKEIADLFKSVFEFAKQQIEKENKSKRK